MTQENNKPSSDFAILHHQELVASRNFFKKGFFITLIALVVVFFIMIGAFSRAPVVRGFAVMMSSDKTVMSVLPIDNEAMPMNEAQLKSDLTQYVETRESFHMQEQDDLKLWLQYVNWHSTNAVLHTFEQDQNSKDGFPTVIGTHGDRIARVSAISFERDANGKPILALVDFSVTGNNEQGAVLSGNYRATITWHYAGTPRDEAIALNNWAGFEVTRFEVSNET